MKAGKLLINFSCQHNDARAFKVFESTAQWKTTEMKLAKNIKNWFLTKDFFVCNILSYTNKRKLRKHTWL